MSKADEIELWFNIPEHEDYQASSNGRIRNKKGKILKPAKNNNLIKIYKSISEASRQTKITIASISYSANKKRKTGGGYIWRFA